MSGRERTTVAGMSAYIVSSGYTDAAYFVVYDSGTVRRIGSGERAMLTSGLSKLKVVVERDKAGLADLYRDSGTYARPDWWDPDFDFAPYTPRPVPVEDA